MERGEQTIPQVMWRLDTCRIIGKIENCDANVGQTIPQVMWLSSCSTQLGHCLSAQKLWQYRDVQKHIHESTNKLRGREVIPHGCSCLKRRRRQAADWKALQVQARSRKREGLLHRKKTTPNLLDPVVACPVLTIP